MGDTGPKACGWHDHRRKWRQYAGETKGAAVNPVCSPPARLTWLMVMQATEREAGCRLTIENQPSVCLPPPAGAEWRAVFVSGAHGSCFAGLWAVLRRLRPSTEIAVQFPLLPEHWHAVEGVCADIEALTTCEVCLSKDRGSHHDGEESVRACVCVCVCACVCVCVCVCMSRCRVLRNGKHLHLFTARVSS